MRRFFFLNRPWTDLFCSFLLNLLQDELHSLSIQGNRSTRFLWTTNYRIDYIIKRFDEENSIISGLFSQNKLLLCGMQGNKALLEKTLKKFKINILPAGSHFLISAKFVVRAAFECLNER